MFSILVPFRGDGGQRDRVWSWLSAFYTAHLRDTEIVIGQDDGTPFSKSCAVNDAAARAQGDVFVILDADAYIDPTVLRTCAAAIQEAKTPLWFVPYKRMFRANQETTDLLLARPPRKPWDETQFVTEPDHLGDGTGGISNRYGALAQIVSRRAFKRVGGWDPRFRGWGQEDNSFARAVDTLYGGRSTTKSRVWHLWHERPGKEFGPRARVWEGQDKPRVNSDLGGRYRVATGDKLAMRALVDEGFAGPDGAVSLPAPGPANTSEAAL